MKRVTVLLCAIVVMACSVCACGTRLTTGVPYLIGVSLANTQEQWRRMLKEELCEAAREYPDVRMIFMNADDDENKQRTDVQKLMDYGVDLMMISPIDVDEMAPVISSVYQQIPVFILDRAIEGLDYTTYIGMDNHRIGVQAAAEAQKLTAGSTHPCRYLIMNNDNFAGTERAAVFCEEAQRYGTQTKTVTLDKATWEQAEDLLENSPELLEGVNLIFACNDSVADGASRALLRLHRSDVRIIGLDGFTGAGNGLDLLQRGRIDATITCPTGAAQAMQNAVSILEYADEGCMPKKIIMRSQVLDRDNVKEYEAARGRTIPHEGRRIRLGYVQFAESTGFRKAEKTSIAEAATTYDIDLQMETVPMELDAQTEQIRQFIREDVDVIAVSPVVQYGWDAVLQEAKNAGIPVIVSDREIDVPDDLYTAYIGSDFEEEGKHCGEWLLQQVRNADRKGADGFAEWNVLELEGTEGASPAEGRKLGFEETIRQEKRIHLVGCVNADFNREKGAAAMQDYLAQHGQNFNVLYSHNDDMALGAMSVLRQNGIRPGQDVLIISVDGTREALSELRRGRINCDAECSPLLGINIMRSVRGIVDGQEQPLRVITDETVFTDDTPADIFRDRAY